MKRTAVLKVDPARPDKTLVTLAADVIKKGGLVAFPTETVYGIAADLSNKKAVQRLYKVKARPRGKPFTVHISDTGQIRGMGCGITKEAHVLIKRFWPGPLTIILKSKNNEKIGFRMPANKIALELIKMSGVPVVAPSANISGKIPPTTAAGVLKSLDGKIDILLDGGRTKVGVESTVVDLTGERLKVLREGAITQKEIEGLWAK